MTAQSFKSLTSPVPEAISPARADNRISPVSTLIETLDFAEMRLERRAIASPRGYTQKDFAGDTTYSKSFSPPQGAKPHEHASFLLGTPALAYRPDA